MKGVVSKREVNKKERGETIKEVKIESMKLYRYWELKLNNKGELREKSLLAEI